MIIRSVILQQLFFFIFLLAAFSLLDVLEKEVNKDLGKCMG